MFSARDTCEYRVATLNVCRWKWKCGLRRRPQYIRVDFCLSCVARMTLCVDLISSRYNVKNMWHQEKPW